MTRGASVAARIRVRNRFLSHINGLGNTRQPACIIRVNPIIAKTRITTHVTLKLQKDHLRLLSISDGLTGLANRRRFDEELDRQWRYCLRKQHPISALLLDIDNFKLYNDIYGHPGGDDCLKAVGALLASVVHRPHDLAARYGGEEFVVLLPDTDLGGAREMAEKLRRGVEDLAIPHAASQASEIVTVSLGVATYLPRSGMSGTDLIHSADQALYAAKTQGRNRVCVAPIEPG